MGDHTDATREASRDSDDPECDRYERCAVCGAMVDTTEWHPVRASFDEGVRIDTICSDECCEQWEAQERDGSEADDRTGSG